MTESEPTAEVVQFEEDKTTVSEPETTDETIELTDWEWRRQQLQMLLQPNYYMSIIGKLSEYYVVAVILFVTLPLTYLFVNTHLSTVFAGVSSVVLTTLIEGSAAIWTVLLKHQTQNAARTLIAAVMWLVAVAVVLTICYDEVAPAFKFPTILGEHAPLVIFIDIACMLLFGMVYHLCDNRAVARWTYIGQKGVAPGELTSVSETVSSVSEIVSNESRGRVSTVSRNRNRNKEEALVERTLRKDNTLSIRAIASQTGLSTKIIGESVAWKNAMIERKKSD